MTRRLAVVLSLVALICSATLAGTPVANLPHSNAPYNHAHEDGPVSMGLSPDGTLWAVWSYTTGSLTDIAVTRAIGNTWTTPVLLGVGNGRTDLDPRIGFTASGTPVVTWWTQSTDDACASVMLSFLMDGQWTRETAFSDPATPASHPAFVQGGGDLSLVFEFTDPTTGEGEINIGPVVEPVPGGGTNGPDPIPIIGVPPPQRESPSDPAGTVETKS